MSSFNVGPWLTQWFQGISAAKLSGAISTIKTFIIQAEAEFPRKGSGTKKFDWVAAQFREACSAFWDRNGEGVVNMLIQAAFMVLQKQRKV